MLNDDCQNKTHIIKEYLDSIHKYWVIMKVLS